MNKVDCLIEIAGGLMKDFVLGQIYQQSMERASKRAHGKFYTPDFIIDFILSKILSDIDVTEKPFVKILDPACGCGFFLIRAYDLLKEKFRSDIVQLREKFYDENYEVNQDGNIKIVKGEQYWQEENLHYHILKHCIYGADIDKVALWLCSASLLAKDKKPYTDELNIVYGDSLFRWEKYYNDGQLIDELKDYRLIYGVKNRRDNKVEYVDRDRAEEILKMLYSGPINMII